VRKVILAMVVELEKKIAAEMKEAGYGSIMHDGWSKNGIHYLGIFICFLLNGVTKIRMLLVSPIHVLLGDECDSDDESPDGAETTEFSA
jgi:hypothetical protein